MYIKKISIGTFLLINPLTTSIASNIKTTNNHNSNNLRLTKLIEKKEEKSDQLLFTKAQGKAGYENGFTNLTIEAEYKKKLTRIALEADQINAEHKAKRENLILKIEELETEYIERVKKFTKERNQSKVEDKINNLIEENKKSKLIINNLKEENKKSKAEYEVIIKDLIREKKENRLKHEEKVRQLSGNFKKLKQMYYQLSGIKIQKKINDKRLSQNKPLRQLVEKNLLRKTNNNKKEGKINSRTKHNALKVKRNKHKWNNN